MVQHIVQLIREEKNAAETEEDATDMLFSKGFDDDESAEMTLLMPDFAMPEEVKNAMFFPIQRASVASELMDQVDKTVQGSLENVKGPWNADAKMSGTQFLCDLEGSGASLHVRNILSATPRKIREEDITALVHYGYGMTSTGEGRLVVRQRPSEFMSAAVCEELDRVLEKACRPEKKTEKNKHNNGEREIKKFNLAYMQTVRSVVTAAKYAIAAPLFFGESAIYHWSNINFILSSATLTCLHFLVKHHKSAGPRLGFARPLRTLAITDRYRISSFSFPLVREEVYVRCVNKEAMEEFHQPNKAVWRAAYALFHEIITRTYCVGHPLKPWDEGKTTRAKCMDSSRKPFTGAVCVEMATLRSLGIEYFAASVELLRRMECVELVKDSKNQEYLYVRSMKRAEEMLAETIAIVNRRAMKGYHPTFRANAAQAFITARDARQDNLPRALNDQQLEAVKSVIVNGFTVLVGQGGSGKTATCGMIKDCIFKPDETLNAAPTCAATSRLGATANIFESVHLRTMQYYNRRFGMWNAQTPQEVKHGQEMVYGEPTTSCLPGQWPSMVASAGMQRLAGCSDELDIETVSDEFRREFRAHFPFVDKQGTHPRYMEETNLAAKEWKAHWLFEHRNIRLAISDEGAMTDERHVMYLWFLATFGNLCRILFIGDDKQISPVGPGKPLRTFLEKNVPGINVVRLKKNHRVTGEAQSLVRNALALMNQDIHLYKVDDHSRILFRRTNSIMWLAAQMEKSTGDLENLVAITNKVYNAKILNAAFYVIFVWRQSGIDDPSNMEQLARRLRNLLQYLAVQKHSPFIVGCRTAVESSEDIERDIKPEEEENLLKSLHIYYTAGMRMAFTKNYPKAGIMSNRQLIIRGFVDVLQDLVTDALTAESPYFGWSGDRRDMYVRIPHGQANEDGLLRCPEERVQYTATNFPKMQAFNEYQAYQANSLQNKNPIMRCMVYSLYSPHAFATEDSKYWVPIQLKSLSLNNANAKLDYAGSGNTEQGREFPEVYCVWDLPRSILPKGKPDSWTYNEHAYTEMSRAQDKCTLVVDGSFAYNMPNAPQSTQLCVVTEMESPAAVGGKDFFGFAGMINRVSPLPPTLLHEFAAKRMEPMKKEMEMKKSVCKCHRQHKFVVELLTYLSDRKRARDPAVDDDEDEHDYIVDDLADALNEPVTEAQMVDVGDILLPQEEDE